MPIPAAILAKTPECERFFTEMHPAQDAHVADAGNRFGQYLHGAEDGPARTKLIRTVPDGQGGEKRVYADGPTDVEMRAGTQKPAGSFYEFFAYEAVEGNGWGIRYWAQHAPITYEMALAWGPAADQFAYSWREVV